MDSTQVLYNLLMEGEESCGRTRRGNRFSQVTHHQVYYEHTMQLWWQLPLIPAIISGILVAVGFVGAGYFFWRKTYEEHFDLIQAFDGLIYSAGAAFVASRLTYIIFRGEWEMFALAKFINIWQYPGLWAPAGLVAGFATFAWTARHMKREAFEVWDYYALVVAWFLGWYWLSRLVLGAAAGVSTNWPIGIVFPQRVEPAHPVQLYAAAGYLLIFRYLWWAEPRYRFFLWYRSRKRTAKSGFLIGMFMILAGLLGVVLGFVQYPFLMVFDFDINQLFYAVLFLTGCVLLYVRSGQSFFVKREKGKHAASFTGPTAGTEATS